MSRRRLIVALIVGAAPLAWTGACVTADEYAITKNNCPSDTDFPIVSQVFERRCGTLDCHGQTQRPFRVYGRLGLRKEEGLGGGDVSGGTVETTEGELLANRASACGLEPERMANVVAGTLPVTDLTLVRKPRLLEAHKGGRVTPKDSDGYRCITSWIEGAVDHAACVAELQKP
ncbi:MAG: hypothetical protein U0414_03940 [Polyangiaceae bacterium]